jgi:hypothetical protein
MPLCEVVDVALVFLVVDVAAITVAVVVLHEKYRLIFLQMI